MPISRLGAIAFDTVDVTAWRLVFVDILGMEEIAPTEEGGPTRYRLDEYEYRISLHPADEERIRLITWEVDTPEELDRLAAALEAADVEVERVGHGPNHRREAERSIRFVDPDGQPTEIRYGASVSASLFHPSGVVSGFRTGEFGLGHVVMHCKNYAASVDFYTNVLGFAVSDYIVWADADATFFHVNGRHHSLALMNECFGIKGGTFNHFMLEVNDLNDTGRAYDKVNEHRIPLTMDFGRHTNDEMTSFYIKTPNGCQLEIGSGGLLIDDATWEVKTWRKTAFWGHRLVNPPAPRYAELPAGA